MSVRVDVASRIDASRRYRRYVTIVRSWTSKNWRTTYQHRQRLCPNLPGPQLPVADCVPIQMPIYEFPRHCQRIPYTQWTEHRALHSFIREARPGSRSCGYCGVLWPPVEDPQVAQSIGALPEVAGVPPCQSQPSSGPSCTRHLPAPAPAWALAESEEPERRIGPYDGPPIAWLSYTPVPGDTEEEIKRPTDHGGSMSQYIPDIKIMAYLAEGQQLEENRNEWLEFNMPGTIVTRRLRTWHLPSRRDADLTIHQWMATSLPTIYPMTPANENDISNEAFESKWPFRIVSTAQTGHPPMEVLGTLTTSVKMGDALANSRAFRYYKNERYHVIYLVFYDPGEPRPKPKRIRHK